VTFDVKKKAGGTDGVRYGGKNFAGGQCKGPEAERCLLCWERQRGGRCGRQREEMRAGW
jgi:hypothetical protein